MVLKACRYFGHTREYWWSSLTWPLYVDLEQQLAEDPPADRLLQLYFAAQKWWTPPEAGHADVPAEDVETWDCPYPDRTE